MNKTAIAITAALASFTTAAQSNTQDDTWYIGGQFGWSQYHDTKYYGNHYLNNDGPTHKNQLSSNAFFGYQANQYLGFDLGYNWLGRMPYKGTKTHGAFKAQGVQLATKLSYPLTQDFNIYTRLGSMVWHSQSKQKQLDKEQKRTNYTGISPVATLGIEYTLTPHWTTHLDYQWINNIGDASTVGTRPDNSQINIGLSYHFGQDISSLMHIFTSPLTKETNHYTFKSDVLFDFDQTNLKKEGRDTLNQICTQLQSMDPQHRSIKLVGYSDSIGSEEYNQKLSEKRTQSVVDYLVSQGVPSDQITSHGEGKTNPISMNTCENIEKRQELIACLAPDRRVEIEVQGLQSIVDRDLD
ncbi:porin OmpA [Candidatus Erwinia haradaeae]|uniref:Outer membrane protein A n=1 Tax=Candidatus Erwinia haradaeae TaxID=1922217 RepID=A0A451D8L7_9GAMM|nr:porin OmpA [Candidatus Erwinia haradaeae]VFP82115.1 Outer membrane protein A [Candidatus Erwinia haradaeae]